jgi:two-component system, NarL family, sensor kinase
VETTIFRVVQECLTNIHRHSGSAAASIRISRSANEVFVEVRDQGKGIPPEQQKIMKTGGKLGVGIRGMRERLRQLGGSLQLSSSEEGTVVIARLPVASALSTAAD